MEKIEISEQFIQQLKFIHIKKLNVRNNKNLKVRILLKNPNNNFMCV